MHHLPAALDLPYGVRMRWDALFADMEAQLAAVAAQDLDAEVADRTRTERARVLLTDRLRAVQGDRVQLHLRSGTVLGVVQDVGAAWVLLVDAAREHLVPLTAILAVSGLRGADVEEPSALRRLGLGHALRAVARDRSLVRVTTGAGTHLGRVDAVGAYHLDLALAYPDSGRPTGETRTVAFAGLDLVSSV